MQYVETPNSPWAREYSASHCTMTLIQSYPFRPLHLLPPQAILISFLFGQSPTQNTFLMPNQEGIIGT